MKKITKVTGKPLKSEELRRYRRNPAGTLLVNQDGKTIHARDRNIERWNLERTKNPEFTKLMLFWDDVDPLTAKEELYSFQYISFLRSIQVRCTLRFLELFECGKEPLFLHTPTFSWLDKVFKAAGGKTASFLALLDKVETSYLVWLEFLEEGSRKSLTTAERGMVCPVEFATGSAGDRL